MYMYKLWKCVKLNLLYLKLYEQKLQAFLTLSAPGNQQACYLKASYIVTTVVRENQLYLGASWPQQPASARCWFLQQGFKGQKGTYVKRVIHTAILFPLLLPTQLQIPQPRSCQEDEGYWGELRVEAGRSGKKLGCVWGYILTPSSFLSSLLLLLLAASLLWC